MVDSKKIAFSLMFIGLDNSGKTLLLKQLEGKNKVFQITPTANVEIHYVHVKDINSPVLCYDLSGQGRHRDNWRTFYEVVDGIGFVIDSEDEVRLKYVKKSIEMVITDEIVKKKQLPIFFFLNKSDKKLALSLEEIDEVLQLTKLEQTIKNPISYKQISALDPKIDEIEESFVWLKDNKTRKNKQ